MTGSTNQRSRLPTMYTVIHNYGNSYEKRNIFVAWPRLWIKLGAVKPEIMLRETVLNLSTLRYVTLPRNMQSRILTAWDKMDQRIIDKAVRQWRTHLHACIKAIGGHFEHTLRQ